tara:strand:- start:8284 stop:8661 length:378 start_codon:yes stop_codon:yes gene_type:complete
MAQNFRRYKLRNVGTVAADIPDGANFDSFDTIVGIHCANRTSNSITVDVFITDNTTSEGGVGSTDTAGNQEYYLIKGAPIAAGGALQLLDGGAKIVVASGDRLFVKSDTASSLDVWVSAVDAIST